MTTRTPKLIACLTALGLLGAGIGAVATPAPASASYCEYDACDEGDCKVAANAYNCNMVPAFTECVDQECD